MGIELRQFDIPQDNSTFPKDDPLADFIIEFTILDEEGETDEAERWTIQTNGSST